MSDLVPLTDGAAADYYAQADSLERAFKTAPDTVGHRRLQGSRNVNWIVGPPGAQVLVRQPREDVVHGITRPQYREPDILREFTDSGITPKLLHDGGNRHIQEYLPGEPIRPNGANWPQWLSRAPQEVPHILAVMARGGGFLDTHLRGASNALPAQTWWEARAQRTHDMWANAWAKRAHLYAQLGIPSRLFQLLRTPLTGNRPLLGMHGDAQPANFLLPNGGPMRVVDLEMFSGGDPAADMARVIMSSYVDEQTQAVMTENFVETMRSELPPAASDGLHEDIAFYLRYFAADWVMGTLNIAVTRLERLADARQGLAEAEKGVGAAVDHIVETAAPLVAKFGRDPPTREHVTNTLTTYVHTRYTYAPLPPMGDLSHDQQQPDRDHQVEHPHHGPALGRSDTQIGIQLSSPGDGRTTL